MTKSREELLKEYEARMKELRTKTRLFTKEIENHHYSNEDLVEISKRLAWASFNLINCYQKKDSFKDDKFGAITPSVNAAERNLKEVSDLLRLKSLEY